jgi:anti-sigma regulatory factor (Ser/Thr protein kinase)
VEFVSYDIESNDFRRAGAASRAIKEHLKRIGAEAEAIRRTMIAAYEAEMNVVIHSVGGRLEAALTDSRIDVNVIDEGPGIPDVEQAMTEGFSTAGAEARALGFGAGMGLPNIKRNSDRLRVTSRVGEGTRVSFTVFLKPGPTCAVNTLSLYASADRCRECRACLAACPTQAMRVRKGRPSVLEHLCIDCAQCIAACGTGALGLHDDSSPLEELSAREGMVLAVPQGLLAGCGSDYPPTAVLAALGELGFSRVVTVEPFEQALRQTVGAAAARAAGGAAPLATPTSPAWTPPPGPLIVPSCPAVVNLVELRFPSLLPLLAPFETPWEALRSAYVDSPVTCVVSCPAQRSALLRQAQQAAEAAGAGCVPSELEFLLPEAVRKAALIRLTGSGDGAQAAASPRTGAGATAAAAGSPAPPAAATSPAPPAAAGAAEAGVLRVDGLRHVIAVLEQVENGLLPDVAVVEPYACAGGCMGSPLLPDVHAVAAFRWSRAGALPSSAATGAAPAAAAAPRRSPYAARPGIRLDPDMGRAIHKLGELQATLRLLPGKDCGVCGAPTCAALAEDIVMGRADLDLCPYLACEREDVDS